MRGEGIDDNVSALIAAEIHSVLELESLLLLYSHPERQWIPEEAARELGINLDWARRELERLASRGFALTEAGRYRYAALGPLHLAVAGLAEAYAQRRVTVIELIYSKPADPVQSFADAFRLRKERRDG